MKKVFTLKVLVLISLVPSIVLSAQEKPASEADSRERYGWTLGYEPDRVVDYYNPKQNITLDMGIFFPAQYTRHDKRPCIIFFFGGGWTGGDQSQFYGISKYFASRGMVAITAEYRTHNKHNAIPRNCVEDGRQAVRYVRQHAAELGIDPQKIAVGGGSAGGHVAAAVAMCPTIDAKPKSTISSMPNALVLFNPVYNNGPKGYGHSRVAEYWEDISPYHNIRKGLPPTIVFFGTNDSCVPVAQVNDFQDAMVHANNISTTYIYDDEKHGFFHISKGGRRMFEDVLQKADAFLVKQKILTDTDQVKPWTAQAIAHAEESSQVKRPREQKRKPKKKQASKVKAEVAAPVDYPWQNVTGSLQQNWFELHDGLKNSQYLFVVEKKGTVAFVGGSITGMPWRKKVMENLKRRFPSTEFNFILAGVGSTGTMYGAFRLARDVIQKGKVDLLFEEAAVNDVAIGRTSEQSIHGMEGIIRHARQANPDMDIVMMHFACTEKIEDYEDGKTPEVIESFDTVAAHYGVPTLDITKEVYERIERGEFTWKDDIKGVHPSPFGQQLYADSIERLLDEAWSDPPRPVVAHAMPEEIDSASYSEGKLFAPRIAKKLNGFTVETDYNAAAEGGKVRTGWNERPQLIGHKPGDSFEVGFEGSAVAIQVIAGPQAGIIEHSVDGSDWVEQDLFVEKNSFKLHLNRIYILREGLDPDVQHTLSVRISEKRNALSKGNNCRIVYFGLNGDHRTPKGVDVDGIYFDGSNGTGPEK